MLTGVPRAMVDRRRAHRRARLLLVAAGSGPLLGILALAVALGRGTGAPVEAPAAVGDDRAFAQVAADDVLAGRPTQLPFVAGLDPYLGRDVAGAAPAPVPHRSMAWRSATRGSTGGEGYEIDTFVVTGDAGVWRLAVEVLDGPSGPVIGAAPSLAPEPTAPAAGTQPLSYAGLDGAAPADLGPGAGRQVQAWATAYVGGDPATLYRLTGDTGDDVFATLEGWSLDAATVGGTVVRGDAALVQLTVTLHRQDDPSVHLTSSYDLLLGDLHQALPWVQAWGPPGSGPTLRPLANAIPAHP